MARRTSNSPGLGLGAGVGAVAVNTCSSEDKSMFCQASRIFQIIGWIFSTLVFLWVAYVFFDIYVLSKRGKRSKGFF
jgi:hypothetical protein